MNIIDNGEDLISHDVDDYDDAHAGVVVYYDSDDVCGTIEEEEDTNKEEGQHKGLAVIEGNIRED